MLWKQERSSERDGFPERPSRHDDQNLLPSVFAIDPEMRVKREDAGGRMQFREPNKAGIRLGNGSEMGSKLETS